VSDTFTTPIPKASHPPVPEPQATLLARLQAGWTPLPFVLPPVTVVKINERDITRRLASIRVVDNTLQIRYRDRQTDFFSARRLHARTADGGILTGRISDSSRQFMFDDPLNRLDVVDVCQEWQYMPGSPPMLWVAALESMTELPGPGNLIIRWLRHDRAVTVSTNLRLHRPGLTSYFIETKENNPAGMVWLCLQTENDPSLMEALHMDLQLLRLVLACPMRPGVFYGLDAEGRTVAAQYITDKLAAREVSTGLQSPVPLTHQQIRSNPICVWVAPFYERLAPRFLERQTANAFSYSLARYAHTITSLDVDTQYLLVAGALGVLLKYLARQPDATVAVKAAATSDARQPKLAWLLGNDKEPSYDVENEILANYARLVGLRAERAVLTDLDPQAGPLVATELIMARCVFEQGAFSSPEEPMLSRPTALANYNRLQQLRRAYAVVLGHCIGYQGPVNQFPTAALEQGVGWLREAEPTAEILHEARAFFLVEADITHTAIWPRFGIEELPENALISQLSAFANDFRQTTQGSVTARLRLLPRRPSEPVRFSFRLMVNNAPATQVALFTVELASDGLVVRGWTDQPVALGTAAELDIFVQTLIRSEKLRYEMQRLLLLEEDIRRGEA
jgi:hypothetical protein